MENPTHPTRTHLATLRPNRWGCWTERKNRNDNSSVTEENATTINVKT